MLTILQCGSIFPETIEDVGNFDAWFIRVLEERNLELRVVDGTNPGFALPEETRGVIVTGSLASAADDEPWILHLIEVLQALQERPILGVCFGHQLLARTFGGRVTRCERGPELGSTSVTLTDDGLADPLFAGFTRTFSCQETHYDEIAALPSGAVLLALNDHSSVQAFRLGEKIRGIQFHPEMGRSEVASVLKAAAKRGSKKAKEVLMSITETPMAGSVLKNFVDLCNKRIKPKF